MSPARRALAKSWKRLDGIDLIRGIAILFVLMNHVNMQLLFAQVPYTRGLPRQLVSSLVWNGQFGVQMFFAVSGFLITSTTLRRWGSVDKVRPRDFYLLRFARIAPLLLMLLAVLSALHLAGVQHFIVGQKTGGLESALFAALTFRVNVLEATRGYLPGSWDILWSLSVEETFYLFFPLACKLFGRGKLLVALLLGFVVLGPFGRTVFAHGNPVWHEYSYLGAMDAIALGCLTALLIARVHLSRRLLWVCGISGAGFAIFILGFSRTAYAWGLGRAGLDMTILGLGTCLLIAVSAEMQWRGPRFLVPILWLGRRSYEVYLIHMFLVIAVFGLFMKFGKPLAAVPVLFVTVIVLSGLLGEAVARSYSEPMNKLLRNKFGDGADRLGSVVDRSMVSVPKWVSQPATKL
ncbi:MAG: acyltransferase family protein [Acidobacteriaceae bacterium]